MPPPCTTCYDRIAGRCLRYSPACHCRQPSRARPPKSARRELVRSLKHGDALVIEARELSSYQVYAKEYGFTLRKQDLGRQQLHHEASWDSGYARRFLLFFLRPVG